MLPYLSIGPLLVRTPGLAVLLGLWTSISLAEKEASRLKLNGAAIYNLVFYAVVFGLLGARLAYAVRYLSIYLSDPLSLLALNTNTLAVFEGLLAGLLTGGIYGRRKGLPLRPTLDALAPGLAAFMIALGLAHLLGGDAYGSPARLPWSVYLWSEYRHPTQIFEILAATAIFLYIRRRPLEQEGAGLDFLLTASLLAMARIAIEAFRGDSLVWQGGWRAAQLVGLLVVGFSLIIMERWRRDRSPIESQPLAGGNPLPEEPAEKMRLPGWPGELISDTDIKKE